MKENRTIDQFCSLTPLNEETKPPQYPTPYSAFIYLYGLSESSPGVFVDRHPLAPARAIKELRTNLLVNQLHPAVIPLVSTPLKLKDLSIITLSAELEEGKELRVTIESFRHDSINLSHGDPIAIIQFIRALKIDGD